MVVVVKRSGEQTREVSRMSITRVDDGKRKIVKQQQAPTPTTTKTVRNRGVKVTSSGPNTERGDGKRTYGANKESIRLSVKRIKEGGRRRWRAEGLGVGYGCGGMWRRRERERKGSGCWVVL